MQCMRDAATRGADLFGVYTYTSGQGFATTHVIRMRSLFDSYNQYACDDVCRGAWLSREAGSMERFRAHHNDDTACDLSDDLGDDNEDNQLRSMWFAEDAESPFDARPADTKRDLPGYGGREFFFRFSFVCEVDTGGDAVPLSKIELGLDWDDEDLLVIAVYALFPKPVVVGDSDLPLGSARVVVRNDASISVETPVEFGAVHLYEPPEVLASVPVPELAMRALRQELHDHEELLELDTDELEKLYFDDDVQCVATTIADATAQGLAICSVLFSPEFRH